jgi:hypothetical protein
MTTAPTKIAGQDTADVTDFSFSTKTVSTMRAPLGSGATGLWPRFVAIWQQRHSLTAGEERLTLLDCPSSARWEPDDDLQTGQ